MPFIEWSRSLPWILPKPSRANRSTIRPTPGPSCWRGDGSANDLARAGCAGQCRSVITRAHQVGLTRRNAEGRRTVARAPTATCPSRPGHGVHHHARDEPVLAAGQCGGRLPPNFPRQCVARHRSVMAHRPGQQRRCSWPCRAGPQGTARTGTRRSGACSTTSPRSAVAEAAAARRQGRSTRPSPLTGRPADRRPPASGGRPRDEVAERAVTAAIAAAGRQRSYAIAAEFVRTVRNSPVSRPGRTERSVPWPTSDRARPPPP